MFWNTHFCLITYFIVFPYTVRLFRHYMSNLPYFFPRSSNCLLSNLGDVKLLDYLIAALYMLGSGGLLLFQHRNPITLQSDIYLYRIIHSHRLHRVQIFCCFLCCFSVGVTCVSSSQSIK